jgi:hypothetical protein
MGTLGAIRKELNNAANELLRNRLLNRLPANLKERMLAEGGDIITNVDDNTYRVTGCPAALSEEIMAALNQR